MNDGFARVLGFFFVGIGHIFKGKVVRGVTFFAIYSILVGFTAYQYVEMTGLSDKLITTQDSLTQTENSIRSYDLGEETIQGYLNLNWSSMETTHPELYVLYSDWQRYAEDVNSLTTEVSNTKTTMFSVLAGAFLTWLVSFIDICRLTVKQNTNQVPTEQA